jgi:WD40 repeat protein
MVIWDLERTAAIHVLEGHTNIVKNISLLPDDKTLVTGSHDGTIRLWDTMSGLCKMTLQASEKVGHDQEGQQDLPDQHVEKKKFAETVSAMQVLENSRIVSGGVGGFIRIWDGLTG